MRKNEALVVATEWGHQPNAKARRRGMRLAITIMIMAALVLVGWFTTGNVQADTVQKAERQLTKAERDVAKTLKQTTTSVEQLNRDAAQTERNLVAPKTLPEDLSVFNEETQRLTRLAQSLEEEITNYAVARDEALQHFDEELKSIHGRVAREQMERVKKTALSESDGRLQAAQQSLQDLRRLLQQGEDLGHVTKCLEVIADVARRDGDLAARTQEARAVAAAYERQATTLLTRITSITNAAD